MPVVRADSLARLVVRQYCADETGVGRAVRRGCCDDTWIPASPGTVDGLPHFLGQVNQRFILVPISDSVLDLIQEPF